MIDRKHIYDVINDEIKYGETLWKEKRAVVDKAKIGYEYYEAQDDKDKSVETWICWMESYLLKAREEATSSENKLEALNNIRKVVALGVACMQHKGAPTRFILKK